MIRFIKLVTGEELVSFTEDKGDYYLLSTPVRMTTQLSFEDPPVAPQTRIDLWCPHLAELKYKIKKDKVVFIEDPHQNLADHYKENYLEKVKA